MPIMVGVAVEAVVRRPRPLAGDGLVVLLLLLCWLVVDVGVGIWYGCDCAFCCLRAAGWRSSELLLLWFSVCGRDDDDEVTTAMMFDPSSAIVRRRRLLYCCQHRQDGQHHGMDDQNMTCLPAVVDEFFFVFDKNIDFGPLSHECPGPIVRYHYLLLQQNHIFSLYL
jgi:hypothetical protein